MPTVLGEPRPGREPFERLSAAVVPEAEGKLKALLNQYGIGIGADDVPRSDTGSPSPENPGGALPLLSRADGHSRRA